MEKPVRKIGKNTRSVVGFVSRQQKNVQVQYESTLERDFIYLIEFDNQVMEYVEQPLTIEYDLDGTRRYYTPDFLVRYMPGKPRRKPLLCEIKYTHDLNENKLELEHKFRAAENYCKKVGYEFKIVTENEIRTPHLLNVKFLLNYRRNETLINPSDIDVLTHNLKKMGKVMVDDLINACASNFEKKAELIYTLWFLVANNRIECNLDERLTMKSEIWI